MGDFNPAEADKVLQQMRQQVTVQALTNLINVRNHVCVARERERERGMGVQEKATLSLGVLISGRRKRSRRGRGVRTCLLR